MDCFRNRQPLQESDSECLDTRLILRWEHPGHSDVPGQAIAGIHLWEDIHCRGLGCTDPRDCVPTSLQRLAEPEELRDIGKMSEVEKTEKQDRMAFAGQTDR